MLEKKSDNSNNNNLQIQLEEQLNSFSTNILNTEHPLPNNNNNLQTNNISLEINNTLNEIYQILSNRGDYESLFSSLNLNYNNHFNNFSLNFNNIRDLLDESYTSSQNVFRLLLNSQENLFSHQSILIRDYSSVVDVLNEVTQTLSFNFEEISNRFIELQTINQNTLNIVSNLIKLLSSDKLNKYTIIIIFSLISTIGYFSYKDIINVLSEAKSLIKSINDRLNIIETVNNNLNLEEHKNNFDLKNLIFLFLGFLLANFKKK